MVNNNFDYNDLRKYLFTYAVPNWNELTELERGILISYYCVPIGYDLGLLEAEVNEALVKAATPTRQLRIDKGRAYINLHFKSNPTLGGLLYDDTAGTRGGIQAWCPVGQYSADQRRGTMTIDERIDQIEADLATARANWKAVTEISTQMTDEARQSLEALEQFCGVSL